MENWQIEYISFANYTEDFNKNKHFKLLIDYLGSYHDPKRGFDEIRKGQNEDSPDSEIKVIYKNINYGKEPKPIVRLETKEEKKKFEIEFDKAMKIAFGEGYEGTKIVVPSRGGEETGSSEEPDEIIVG